MRENTVLRIRRIAWDVALEAVRPHAAQAAIGEAAQGHVVSVAHEAATRVTHQLLDGARLEADEVRRIADARAREAAAASARAELEHLRAESGTVLHTVRAEAEAALATARADGAAALRRSEEGAEAALREVREGTDGAVNDLRTRGAETLREVREGSEKALRELKDGSGEALRELRERADGALRGMREPHWSGPARASAVEILHLFGPRGDQAGVRAGRSAGR